MTGSGRFSRPEPPDPQPPDPQPPDPQPPDPQPPDPQPPDPQPPEDKGLGQELTLAQVAALTWHYDSLPGSELRLLDCHARAQDGPPAPEAIAAGFTHHVGGNGTGFEAGGALDAMLPGGKLAVHLGQVRQLGLQVLPDDALIGAMCGAAKLESFAAEFKLAAAAELDARRASADGTPGEHVSEEVAAALTLTGWSAAALLGLAQQLARLPKTRALLAAGIVDPRRAAVIARHVMLLPDDDAAQVEDLILPRAAKLTTGELNSACQRAVIAIDPAAARKRKDKALRQARVEAWFEDAGTAALAGRDLPPADVVSADQYINAAARWLKDHGAQGTLAQLRAKVFTTLLAGQTLDSLLQSLLPHDHAPATGQHPADQDTPAGQDIPAGQDNTDQDTPAGQDAPAGQDNPAAEARTAPGASGPALTGSVNLTMPLSAWLGRTDNPGEIAGYGAADAGTCRDLAAQLTTGNTRWCITLTDPDGNAVGHGCARAGPGPPRASEPTRWLATVRITPIETSTCSHRRQSAGYQPSDSLRHIVKTRSRRCGFPGCRRAAVRCDDDHTVPYHLGGKSCECNLYPLCRRHHRCKQTPGWQLQQPQPGRLIWTAPSGRTYLATAEPYPV
jgi:Domain of unknown function (DUF222)